MILKCIYCGKDMIGEIHYGKHRLVCIDGDCEASSPLRDTYEEAVEEYKRMVEIIKRYKNETRT